MKDIFSNIDDKDKKLLMALDTDARQTETALAKQLHMSKQVIIYRMKRLQEKKIIKEYYTILNVGNLGFQGYYVFIQLQNCTLQKEKELLKKWNELPYVGWLVHG